MGITIPFRILTFPYRLRSLFLRMQLLARNDIKVVKHLVSVRVPLSRYKSERSMKK